MATSSDAPCGGVRAICSRALTGSYRTRGRSSGRRWNREAQFLPLCLLVLFAAGADADVLTVRDCVRLALTRSPAVQSAAFSVAAASARVRAARAAYAPQLVLQSEYGRSQGFDEAVTNGGSTAALLTLEAKLWDGGVRDAQLAAAGARLRSAAALDQQRRADVALAVRAAYFAAVAARSAAAIHEDSVRRLRIYTTLLQRQVDLGLAPYNDVLRAELATATARAARRAAGAQLDAARAELALRTGTPVAAAALVEPNVAPYAAISDAMIDTSPVVADAQATADAAHRDADAVRSEWRTQVTLTASGGALGVQPGPTFHDNGGGQFLVGLSLPLFDSGATAARIAAAVAAADSADADLREARQGVAVALAQAAVGARRAQADLAASRQAIPRAEENFEIMRARYFGGGSVRLLEVLDALAQYVDARLGEAQALRAYREAVASTRRVLGEATP
jgi:outer membrane protein TolC